MTSLAEQSFQPPPEAEDFYVEGLRLLAESDIPFLLSGTYAVTTYTGVVRPTKDLDIFCKAGDYPRILTFFRDRGYEVAVEDERWIAKIYRGKYFFDVIYSCRTTEIAITDEWFEDAPMIEVYGANVRVIKPTELIWSKIFVQDRYRYDGADVAHVILRQHEAIDWKKLLRYMELHWEVLLTHLINFRYIYPSEREVVPRWLMNELMGRLTTHLDMPPSNVKVCRGRLFSARDYVTDITEWGYADMTGKASKNGMTPFTENMAAEKPLRVAAIGDLHVQESRTTHYRDLFEEISGVADVLVLCGDLTNYGKTVEAQLLAEDLAAATIPVVAVLGNHDHDCGQPEVVKEYLANAGVRVLDGESYEIGGVGFAGCMGAMGGFGRGMLSSFGERSVKAFVHECMEENMKLETSLRMLRTERAVAVTHYAPIAETLEGEPLEILPFLGNGRLAQTIDQFENVRVVVHGHAHRGTHKGATPKGVPVYNCAQMVALAATGRPYALFEV